jgi:hypothetical protein
VSRESVLTRAVGGLIAAASGALLALGVAACGEERGEVTVQDGGTTTTGTGTSATAATATDGGGGGMTTSTSGGTDDGTDTAER